MLPATAFGFILAGMALTSVASFLLPPAMKERQGEEQAATIAMGALILVGLAILGACSFGFGLIRYVELLLLLVEHNEALLIFGLVPLFSPPLAYCWYRTVAIRRNRAKGEREVGNPWVWSILTLEWGLLFVPTLFAFVLAIVSV